MDVRETLGTVTAAAPPAPPEEGLPISAESPLPSGELGWTRMSEFLVYGKEKIDPSFPGSGLHACSVPGASARTGKNLSRALVPSLNWAGGASRQKVQGLDSEKRRKEQKGLLPQG